MSKAILNSSSWPTFSVNSDHPGRLELKDNIFNSRLSIILKASSPIKLLFRLCSYEKGGSSFRANISTDTEEKNQVHSNLCYYHFCTEEGEKRKAIHKPLPHIFLLVYAQYIYARISYLSVTMTASREVNLVVRGETGKTLHLKTLL